MDNTVGPKVTELLPLSIKIKADTEFADNSAPEAWAYEAQMYTCLIRF
jgi:hypothetical protein